MSEWQLINTAPKDHTLICVWFRTHRMAAYRPVERNA